MAGDQAPSTVQECLEWFIRIGLISSDHVLTLQDTSELNKDDINLKQQKDFCSFIRDGVIICKLLYILDPSSIDFKTVVKRPYNTQCLCMKNIGIFLQTCKEKFEIDEGNLFKPQMLFECSNIEKVLSTLSKLSKCPKVDHLQIEGFPREGGDSGGDKECYKALPKLMAKELERVDVSNMRTYEDDDPFSFSRQGMQVYKGLGLGHSHLYQWSDNEYHETFDEQLYWMISADEEESNEEALRKWNLCLQALIETESNYIDALEMLYLMFLKPLREIIGHERCKKIFCNIPDLFKIHKLLLHELKKVQNKTPGVTIAKVMLEYQEKLLIYREYCINLPDALQELESLMTDNDIVRGKIQEQQDALSNGRHQLRDYLVVPLQRIMKYHFYLNEFIRQTHEGGNDLEHLEKAHEYMKDLANFIKQVKRDKEMLQIIKYVQESIINLPENISSWKSTGKFRRDGDITIDCHPEKKNKKRFAFVFDKVIVMCDKSKEEKYKYNEQIRLENWKMEKPSADNWVIGNSRKNKTNSFNLYQIDKTKPITMIAKDTDTRDSWMMSIRGALDSAKTHREKNTTNHSFIITTFETANARCCVCQMLLPGIIYQGYQCGKCKKAAHRKCLSKVAQCPGLLNFISHALVGQGYEHWNLQYEKYPWWAQKLSREESEKCLEGRDDGTFLIRWTDNHNQPILTLRAKDRYKHMRVYEQEQRKVYIHEKHCFENAVELINYYKRNQLSECFSRVDGYLKEPVYDIARITCSFQGSGDNQLPLTKDELIVIISKKGTRGWWKGRINNKTGFFPKNFVTIDNSCMGW